MLLSVSICNNVFVCEAFFTDRTVVLSLDGTIDKP